MRYLICHHYASPVYKKHRELFRCTNSSEEFVQKITGIQFFLIKCLSNKIKTSISDKNGLKAGRELSNMQQLNVLFDAFKR